MNNQIIYVGHLQGEEYKKFMNVHVYGFEKTDEITLRAGELWRPDKTLVDKITKYLTNNDEFEFVELTAYDVIQKSKVTINDPIDMQVTFSTEFVVGAFGFMGKDYRVLRIDDNNVEELSVIKSHGYEVTFETDKLGIFAVIYNTYAMDLSFMLDYETEYSRLENLSEASLVDLPEAPKKEGYIFAGWYLREYGQGKRFYPGMAVAEANGSILYAYWVEESNESLTADVIYDKAFGKNNTALVEVSFGTESYYDKLIFVGDKELFYNWQRDVYVGLIDSSNIGDDKKLKNVTIARPGRYGGLCPIIFTYGNLVYIDNKFYDISDLNKMKLIIENDIALDDCYLIASDLNGDGQCNITDLHAMKQSLEMDIEFPILSNR